MIAPAASGGLSRIAVHFGGEDMRKAAMLVACVALALGAASANAQDKSKDKAMTAQECKDYMAMAAKDAKMKDAKKDTMCNDMMKKDGGAMKSDAPKK